MTPAHRGRGPQPPLACLGRADHARMRGSSFVELMFALAIIGVATMVQIQQVTITLREHSVDLATQFAFQKAAGMLAELQASVDQGSIASIADLDEYVDATPNPVLTTRNVPSPAHLMSGNSAHADNSWTWFRTIDVEPVEGADHSRFVRVRVYHANADGHRTMIGVASSILSVTIRAEPQVQEYDVYALAIAEAPSLWQPLPALRAQLQAAASEIAGANPNLRFRLHWITKMGYGRDPLYTPYVNESARTDDAAPWVYWYPGRLAAGAGASTLYKAELISGRVRTEAGVLHGFDAGNNPYPHAVADRFNHCVRTPEARELFALRVAAGTEKADEPPLQVLLADMHAQPERFKNAILINLHGDGLPFPPMRNYSDAAKDPTGRPGVRVVTHPVRVHTPRVNRGTADAAQHLIDDLNTAALAQSNAQARSELQAAANKANGAVDKLTQVPVDFDGARSELEDIQARVEEAEAHGYSDAYATTLRVRDLVADCTSRSNAMAGPELKVYAYKAAPASGPAVLTEPITLQIMGMNLAGNVNAASSATPTTLEIRRLDGGVNTTTGLPSAGAAYDHFFESMGVPPKPGSAAAPYEMRYEVGYATTPAPHTWIRLYNTPLVTPLVNDDGSYEGLAAADRLYGIEYIPSPVSTVASDLNQDGAQPKNTARWRIRIPPSMLPAQDMQVTVHSRIGADITSGRVWPTAHQPHNLSTTYTWWSLSAAAVPITERYQMMGDPRHNPYEDLGANGKSFPHGYNWWFDDLRNGLFDVSPKWQCLDRNRLHDGFAHGVVEDVPRMLQVWREALQAAGAVFTNPGGPLAARLLLGGEIALPPTTSSGLATTVRVHGALYATIGNVALDDLSTPGAGLITSTGLGTLGGLLGSGGGLGVVPLGGHPVVTSIVGFLAKPWLGELTPDTSGTSYAAAGNLATRDGFARAPRAHVLPIHLPIGTNWAFASGSDLGELGGASLLQINGGSATFVQAPVVGCNATATLTEEAHAFVQTVGVATPRTVSAGIPFSLSAPLTPGPQQCEYPTEFPDHAGALVATFATSDGGNAIGCGVIRLASPTSPTRAAFFVPFADTPATEAEHRALTHKALALGLRALLVAGEPTRSDDVPPVPLVRIEAPLPLRKLVRPDSVQLTWSTTFGSFDGRPYTPSYSSPWQGSQLNLTYVVTYRARLDNQVRFAMDGSPAEPGVWPTNSFLRIGDTGSGNESFVVNLPASRFPAGEYALRVDCFRADGSPHGAHHEVRVPIER